MVTKDLVFAAKQNVKNIIEDAFLSAKQKGIFENIEIPAFSVEIPADTSFGDFSSNIAMVSAKALKKKPRDIAEDISKGINLESSMFCSVEIAGPGFLNFFLNPKWYGDVLSLITRLNDDYGRTNYGAGEKVMIEFVSANPTGPMHMGNARGGAIGDCLAGAMEAAGYDVAREFYINDAGNQIEKFGISLEARYLQIYKGEENVPFPEDGYHGGDIKDRAQEFSEIHGDKYTECGSEERKKALIDYALPKNIEALKSDLLKYRIEYDVWFKESSLYKDGTVDKAMALLRDAGLTYEKDGAVWYRATEFGSEKDEVLIRQNGNATYFAADIAYHYNKFAVRGFNRVIDVWGADHHGHVARLKNALSAAGQPGDKLDIILMQLVRLMKDGEPYRMSKRTGRSITLADIIEDIPIDAARFFFNMREPGSAMDFDLDLAVEETSQNPVYYVQYAHARICSILKRLEEKYGSLGSAEENLLLLKEKEEIELVRELAKFPSVLISVCQRYDPASITHYIIGAATLFHKFYSAHKVDTEDRALMLARKQLILAVKIVIKNALDILKISAPESM